MQINFCNLAKLYYSYIVKIHKSFLVLVIFFFLFFSCSSNDKKKISRPDKIIEVNKLFSLASTNFEDGNNADALKQYLLIYSNYGYTKFADRALLMAAFIYYDSASYYEALEILQKFRKLYPIHKHIDYVDYMISLCVYEQIELASKDQTKTVLALETFNKIMNKHPDSIYTEDILLKIDLVNNQLAGKEMYTARFYMKRGKWLAALIKLNNIVEQYDTTIYIEEALHRLVEIHYRIGNIDTAKKYAAILGYNFNDSDWYKKSYKVINYKNFLKKSKNQKKTFKDKLKALIN